MLNKTFTFFSIFLFIALNNLPLYALNKSLKNISSNLSIDYLDIEPENDYIIGSGDQLNIIVSRFYPELTSSPLVDGEGTIYIPKLNRIYVSGLSISELNNLLNEAYKEFIKYPDVQVEIKTYRPIRVFVQGEVENPGMQILQGSFSLDIFRNDSLAKELDSLENSDNRNYLVKQNSENTTFFPTVFDVIRSSGGITQFTDLSSIQIIRNNNLSNGGGKIETKINFLDVLIYGNSSQNIRVYDGDIVKIKKSNKSNLSTLQRSILSKLSPKFLEVFVTGRVNTPGNTKVSKASTMTDAVDIAGGAKVLRGPVTFLRFNNDGTIDKRKFSYRKGSRRGSYSNPYLRDGDLIIIGESLLTATNQIISEFTNPFIGIFSTYGLIKALQD